MLGLLVAVVAVDVQPPLEAGIAARRAGDIAEAVTILASAVEEQPGNADAWIQYGYALRDNGQREEARAAFGRALALAPEDGDARDGLASLEPQRDRRPAEARLDGAWTGVEGARDWRELSVGMTAPIGARTMLGGALEHSRRFGLDDTYGEARLDARPSAGTGFYALVGATPAADFRPRWRVGAGGSVRLVDGPTPLLATLDAAVARYPAETVTTVSPGIELYVAKGRAWVSGRAINVFADGRHSLGVLGRLDVQASQRLRLFGGAAHAPDLAEGRVLTTTSLFGGASVTLGERVDWRVSLARDEPDGGLDRTTLATGVSLRFP